MNACHLLSYNNLNLTSWPTLLGPSWTWWGRGDWKKKKPSCSGQFGGEERIPSRKVASTNPQQTTKPQSNCNPMGGSCWPVSEKGVPLAEKGAYTHASTHHSLQGVNGLPEPYKWCPPFSASLLAQRITGRTVIPLLHKLHWFPIPRFFSRGFAFYFVFLMQWLFCVW